MKPRGSNPDASALCKDLCYDPNSGELRWVTPRRGRSLGKAGCSTPSGYVVITYAGERHYAHRIAWAIQTGEFPTGIIDHIDGDRSNNRISNLRITDAVGNAQNQRAAQRNNTSGLIGAHYNSRVSKWTSRIRAPGGRKFLGYFDTPEEAHEAYLRAKRELHTTCTI